eukprot:g2346.t1
MLRSTFQRDGAVVIRNLLSADLVSTLEKGIERNLRKPTKRSINASQPGDPGHFVEDFIAWKAIPEYQEILKKSNLGKVAASLTDSETMRLYHDHMLVKEPGTKQETPFHQDMPYYNVSGTHAVSFWIPVDPVRSNTSPTFIAGTHLGPWFIPRTFKDKQAKWFPEGSLRDIPEYADDDERILRWDLEPGDAVAFHFLTVHKAGGVLPGGPRRRAWSVRLVGDDVVHAPRAWKTSPQFDDMDNIPAGHALHCSTKFPLLWPRCEL